MRISLLLTLTTLAAAITSQETKCKVTKIFEGLCNIAGWVQVPDNLSQSKETSSLDCASKCLSNNRCKSLRYVATTQRCYLYGKYLDDMYLDHYDFKPGALYNRNCFTTDCNQIRACSASESCTLVAQGFYPDTYIQYACAYGKTQRPFAIYPSQQSTFSGDLDACGAIDQCAAYNVQGGFDVHYHIPSNQWVCVNYHNVPVYYYAQSLEQQGDGPHRYTLPNDTVGAGYGFALKQVYIGDK